MATKRIGFQKLGLYPHKIGLHSLWSGGAIKLHLARISKHIIKIVEWWHSDVFLIYLQDQVVSFTKGVAAAMSNVRWFTHNTTPIILPC